MAEKRIPNAEPFVAVLRFIKWVAVIVMVTQVVAAAASVSQVDPSFQPLVTYDSGGQYTTAIAVGDLNGDGHADVVAANYNSNTIGVLLGNGDGTLQKAVPYSSGGSNPRGIALGDVNGDGFPDIAVANDCASDCGFQVQAVVAVLLNRGDGTFTPPVVYNSGAFMGTAVAIADVSFDGRPDLLVTHLDGHIGVLLGNGDGTFRPAVVSDVGGSLTTSIAILDRWGKTIVTNGFDSNGDSNGNVAVLRPTGNGAFFEPTIYPSGGVYPSAVAVGDLILNDERDLVVANAYSSNTHQGDGTVAVLFSDEGMFLQPFLYDSGGFTPQAVAIGDFNLDGDPDAVVTNSNAGTNIVVLSGTGRGGGSTFRAPVKFAGGTFPQAVAVADVNGDGKPDIVIGNYSGVGMLLNKTIISTPTTTWLSSSMNPSIYGQRVTYLATVTTTGTVPPTGDVVFSWSDGFRTFVIAKLGLNGNGVSTLTTGTLFAGSYPLTAVYKGDVNNLSSSSPVMRQTVLQTTSTATISSSLNPAKVGVPVTFSARISSPTVLPMGPVTFSAGSTEIGTVQLVSGKATLTTSSLPLGSSVVKVTFGGNSNIKGSSAVVTQVVQP